MNKSLVRQPILRTYVKFYFELRIVSFIPVLLSLSENVDHAGNITNNINTYKCYTNSCDHIPELLSVCFHLFIRTRKKKCYKFFLEIYPIA